MARVLGLGAGFSFVLTLIVLLLVAGYEDAGAALWAIVGLLAVTTLGLAVAAIASAASPSGAGRTLVPFVVCAVVVSPIVGVYVALWVVTLDDLVGFWVVLVAAPALLTAVAGLLMRRSWIGIAVGALASAGLSFGALLALFLYAASQGAFD